MINPDFDAIIFDCDGTLVDSEPITVNVLVDFVNEFGLDLAFEEALPLFVGRDMPGIVAELESRLGSGLPTSFCDDFRQRQAIALRREVRAISGAHELLGAITRQFCVASNAPQDKIKINLTTTGLDRYFQAHRTFSAYDINSWKPEPDLFFFAAGKMSVEVSRCVVIEDSLAGIDAGLAANMQVIGYSPSPDQIPTNKVPFVHSLVDLIEVLS